MSCRLSRCPNHLHYVTPSAGRWATSSCSACLKCANQAHPLPQPTALCHTICSARNSRAPLAAELRRQAAAAGGQVCHAGSAFAPTTCTMSHHLQDGGQQPIRIRIISAQPRSAVQHAVAQVGQVCYAGCPLNLTVSHHLQKRKPSGSRHVKCSCCIPPKRKTLCKNSNGGSLCPHGRQRTWCRDCGGTARCAHGTQRSKCSQCGGSGICSHGKVQCRCRQCREEMQQEYARTHGK